MNGRREPSTFCRSAVPVDGILSSYMFFLPPGLVAQHPLPARDASRLMVMEADGAVGESRFSELPGLLRPGDILVRNNARVLPARLLGKRRGGGAAELLLVRRDDSSPTERWLCMARPANRFKPGREFSFGDGTLTASAAGRDDQGMVWMEFTFEGEDFLTALDRFGQVPLPPYIERENKRPTEEDAERYQTVYAKRPGAVAAPTAGLHFTAAVDRGLAGRGVEVAELTLNVGPGTFKPITEENLDRHGMDAEWYDIPEPTWRAVSEAKARGGRVIAVGTTTARSLEAAAMTGRLAGWTSLFIRPGHEFRSIDGLVTNFHLPGSSLIVLVSALAGRERVMEAYRRAVAGRYRFYSYGDAMLVWRCGGRSHDIGE